MPDATKSNDRNLSAEHQREGDAKRPSDTLDRDQGPEGGQKPEAVEDRDNVSTVSPEDYPKGRPDS